ncbi:MAG: hypothetical protein K6L60_05035 [Oceanobacter sp.]
MDEKSYLKRIEFLAEYDLENFDNSSWKLDDKQWVAKRRAEWPEYEKVLAWKYSKRSIAVCKRYYMKGVLPDKNGWYDVNLSKSLTIFHILWLHPSRDYHTLLMARNAYLNSALVREDWITFGYGRLIFILLKICLQRDDIPGRVYEPDLRENGELLFQVMMDGLDNEKYPLGREGRSVVHLGEEYVSNCHHLGFFKPKPKFNYFSEIADWLICSDNNINSGYIFQYDTGLNWLHEGLCEAADSYKEEFMEDRIRGQYRYERFIESLLTIYHFDNADNSPKSYLARRLKNSLDNEVWLPEVKEIWRKIKFGEICQDNYLDYS